jgi:antitoxin component YwqK of YwqJK toxin-antitoxin module
MDAEKDLPRVLDEQLEYDDDINLLNGVPYTGIGYQKYPNGQLEYESIYREGLPEGLQREWFPSGQLKSECHAVRGLGPSKIITWYESGQVQSMALYDIGIMIEQKEWGEDGELLKDKGVIKGSGLKT